jgi:hypothetical protein
MALRPHRLEIQTTSVRIYLRDGSCDDDDHPSDHDVGGLLESGQRFGCADSADLTA